MLPAYAAVATRPRLRRVGAHYSPEDCVFGDSRFEGEGKRRLSSAHFSALMNAIADAKSPGYCASVSICNISFSQEAVL